MAQLPSFRRQQPTDLIAAPISAFESETQAVLQRTAPYHERGIIHVVAGMVVLSLVLMCFVKLDRLVVGTGHILPSQGSLFVQPIDRAIVTGILVKTGDVVHKGQVLATLDPTFASADLKDAAQKKASDEALVARLKAEQEGRPYIPDPANPFSATQMTIWRQRQTEYSQAINDYGAQIGVARSQVNKGRQDSEAYARMSALAEQQEQAQLTLQAKGFGSKSKLLAATSAKEDVTRQAASSRNDAAQFGAQASSVAAQRAVYIGKWHDDISTQLVTAQNELADLTQTTTKAGKVSSLTELVAPRDAIVLKIAQASVGSVVDTNSPSGQSGSEPLFTLTPLDGPLEAELQVKARDIGFIRVGDSVRVKLDAFRFTQHGTAKGVIRTISEGAFTDSQYGPTPDPYYKVRVGLTDVHLRNVPGSFRLIPGMTLQGDVLIGSRTIMSYLLEGGLRTGSEAMREPQ